MKNEKLKCDNCGASLSKDAKFCLDCGTPVSDNGKFVCPKCGKESPNNAKFCQYCGLKLQEKIPFKNIPWNFDSKLIFISFMLCALLGTYLFMSSGFMMRLFGMDDANALGIIGIVVGLLIIFVINKKEKLDLKKEFDNLKQLKLTLNLAGLTFIVSGGLIVLGIGNESRNLELYIIPALVLFVSFISFIGLVVINNLEKLHTGINVVAQVLCIIASLISFGAAIALNNHGNEMNSNYESQFTSFWENGTANPGNEYIEYSRYAAVAGVAFLVGFFILRTSKVKENQIANVIIAIFGTLAILILAFMVLMVA